MKTKPVAKRKAYVRPTIRTVVTPKEIGDIDQPCAFVSPPKKRGGKK